MKIDKTGDPIFDFIFRHFSKIWLGAVVLILLTWIGMAFVGLSLFDQVRDHGLKSVVERIWEGQ